jgi:hypothetical protein
LTTWENEILSNQAFFESYGFVFFPVEKGTKVNKVWIEEVRPANWSPQLGMVKIDIDPDEPWAGLIHTQTAYPGMYNHFTGGNNLASQIME